jgi:RNA 3'-terminal phosphate cyclase (ATP)
MIHLDGSKFRDADALLLSALTLSAVTGEPFEIDDIGRGSGSGGVTPFHITALRTIGTLVRAEVKGESVRARRVRFTPTTAPRAGDFIIDTADSTGRPSPVAVTPLIEALQTVLSTAEGDSLITIRGVNAHPLSQSVFWMRETLNPVLNMVGYNTGVEIERWGWYPDGGGECTLSVTPRDDEDTSPLRWEQRGKLKTIWVTAALSSRMEEAIGQKMIDQFLREVAFDKIERSHIETDIVRVRSGGSGYGLFITMETDTAVAGFEAVGDGNTLPVHLAERCAKATTHYLTSTAVLDGEVARALLIPLALTQRAVSLTTPTLTAAHDLLEQLIPQFLPVFCAMQNRQTARSIELVPTK